MLGEKLSKLIAYMQGFTMYAISKNESLCMDAISN